MLCNNCGSEIINNKCKCDTLESKIKESAQTKMIFEIFSISSLVLAICFTIVSFVLSGVGQIVVITFAILFYIAFFVCNGIKIKKLKKKEQK